MIVASLLLILVAVVLLVLGLGNGSSLLLITSIAASLLAAVALVVGARQAAAIREAGGARTDGPAGRRGRTERPGAGDDSSRTAGHPAPLVIPAQSVRTTEDGSGRTGWRQPPGPTAFEPDPGGADAARTTGADTPLDRRPGWAAGVDIPAEVTSDRPDADLRSDEPPAQSVGDADAARVARLATPVLVVDGRPRYHLDTCAHLVARETEVLPVSEAVELGFTPCAWCAPDTALLADAHPR